MACKKIIIKGNIQGVGFRFATLKKAKEIGAFGFVENQLDGSVIIVVSGKEREVRLMEKWISDNDTPGFVDSYTAIDYPDEHLNDFKIRY